MNLRDVKAIIVGACGSFMLFVMVAPIIVLKNGPFNLSPPAVFLEVIGLNFKPLPWLFHFFYGMFWSWLFVRLFGEAGNLYRGVGFALLLWLVMMTVFSPVIGWGFFGQGNAYLLDPDSLFFLSEGWSYAGITLVLHLVYGVIIGTVNPLWNKVDTL